MKIDVERYKVKILNEARGVLEDGVIDKFMIEVHKDVIRTEDIMKFLAGYSYVIDKVIQFGDVKDMVYARTAH